MYNTKAYCKIQPWNRNQELTSISSRSLNFHHYATEAPKKVYIAFYILNQTPITSAVGNQTNWLLGTLRFGRI